MTHSHRLFKTSLAKPSAGGSAAVHDGQVPAANETSVQNKQLLTFPRFEPHALMQPTLFNTGDDPAGGVALQGEGYLAGGGEGDRGGGGEGWCRQGGGTSVGGSRLLNAWEKIKELEGLVESSRANNERWESNDGKRVGSLSFMLVS